MDVMGQQVYHGKFGEGTVVGQTEATVSVEFEKKHGTRKFIYPSAFETFLSLCDQSAKEKMNRELKRLQKQAETERRERDEAEANRREEERVAALEEKRAAAKRRSSAKKTPAKSKK